MLNEAVKIAAEITREHPGWVVTVLFRATAPPLYCARRSGQDVNACRSEDPDDLAWLIEQEEGSGGGG